MVAKRRKSAERQAAIRLSRQFFGADPRAIHKLSIDWPTKLTALGEVGTLSYICDKEDGKMREWLHRFKRGAVLLAAPKRVGKSPYSRMLVIVGDFKITSRGITG